MSDFWGVQESIVSIHTVIQSSKKANIFIENVNSSDKVFLLMVTDTDAFEVYPSSGRIKGKGTVSVTVERLSTDAEIGVAVIVRECSYEVPDEDDDCWHCIFENEPSQKHMFLKIIDFNHNSFGKTCIKAIIRKHLITLILLIAACFYLLSSFLLSRKADTSEQDVFSYMFFREMM